MLPRLGFANALKRAWWHNTIRHTLRSVLALAVAEQLRPATVPRKLLIHLVLCDIARYRSREVLGLYRKRPGNRLLGFDGIRRAGALLIQP